MFSRNTRILLSEFTLASLLIQIVVGSIPGAFAINQPVHDLIQTHSAVSSQAFVMGGTTYLAIANRLSGSPAEIVIPSASGTSTSFQALPSSASALEYFTVSGESYMAVADPYGDDVIYHFDGSSFTGFQTLPSDIYATDFSSTTIAGVDMLAIANSNPASTSKMYAWTGTGFTEAYSLAIGGGLMSDVEVFHADNYILDPTDNAYVPYAELLADFAFISRESTNTGYHLSQDMPRVDMAYIVANAGGYTPTGCVGNMLSDVTSTLGVVSCSVIELLYGNGVITLSGSIFSPYSPINRGEAIQMLLRAVGESGSTTNAGYLDTAGLGTITDYINRANEMGCIADAFYFYPMSSATRGEIYRMTACVIGFSGFSGNVAPHALTLPPALTGDYLALADGQIYEATATGATHIQNLFLNGPTDIHFMTVGDEQMLTFLDHGSSQLFIYKLKGNRFIRTQSISLQTSGGGKLSFDTFIYQGNTYIITPLGFSDASAIYVYRDGQFELTQKISSTGLGVSDLHSSWTYFTLSGQPYLFLANGFNTTNSAIYKWTPLPYVVIQSPVSGESYDYNQWDPSRTPITGIATPGVDLSIYDGAGNMIGSGSVTVSGEFSILTTANSGSVLPIRVVPYNNLAGEEKTINYLNIIPTPMPTASHGSMVYRDPFVLTVSGESSYYGPAPSPVRIRYDLYRNNIFSVSGEFNGTQSFSVSGEDTRIAYYGVDASGAITATQEREFHYDNVSPTLVHNVTNSIAGAFIQTGSLTPATAPIVTLTGMSPTRFIMRATNPDTATGITLSGITLDIKTMNGSSYTGNICIRELGNTNDCGLYGTTTSQIFPGLNREYSLSEIPTNTIIAPNNGYIDYEIYLSSAYIADTVSVVAKKLTYTDINGSPIFANYNLSIMYLQGGGMTTTGTGVAIPTFSTTDLYYVTGTLANISLGASDAFINFTGTGESLLLAAGAPLNNISTVYTPSGMYAMYADMSGTYPLVTGTQNISHALTDLVGNTATGTFSVYRLPAISNIAIIHTGSTVLLSFDTDIVAPIEMSYVSSTMTGSVSLSAQAGNNTMILTGVTMTGSVSATVGVQQALSGMMIPTTVYTALKQSMSYTFDSVPDTFTFVPRLSIALGMAVDYGPVTLSGFNMPISARVSTGNLQVNGASYGTGMTFVSSGDTIQITLTAGSTYGTTYSGQLYLGSLTPIAYRLETNLAPILTIVPLPVVGPITGGGGGGGSSSISMSTSSQGTASSPMMQGLMLNNMLFADKKLNTIANILQDITRDRSMADIRLLVRDQLVSSVLIDITTASTYTDKINRINVFIVDYSSKMQGAIILSNEYKVYRAARKELTRVKKELPNK